MNRIKVRIEGTRPLLMHASTGADPLNPLTKQHKVLTSKRKKTDEDYEQIAKSEWLMALYYEDGSGVGIPGVSFEASIISGAKLSKLGATIKRGVEVLDDFSKLEYDGPKEPEALWKAGFYDARPVKVGQARLIRYRPVFRKWACTFEVLFDDEVINKSELLNCISDAGAYCGIGDYRPKFGRYSVQEVQ